ncbi:hypothetical protein MHK_001105 [Candidatus Magnetomorum sp. HK-1]|nr:hypothetical protein MHK_001105 [Candidatus Magnetomorum sp. HK-1]
MNKNDDITLKLENEILDIIEAEKNMFQNLENAKKIYIPIKDIVRKIPRDLRNRLNIKSTAPVKNLRKQMERLMGKRLKIFPGKRSTYIGKNMLPEELIVFLVKNHPDISLGLLFQKLPLSKKQSTKTINELIELGVLLPRVNEKLTVFFSLKDPNIKDNEIIKRVKSDESKEKENDDENSQAAFHKAYQTVGKGRNFVRIHRIREKLNWPGEKFDHILKSLMASYTVEIHGGDPSSMSENEILNSFKDENGRIFLTISWRK